MARKLVVVKLFDPDYAAGRIPLLGAGVIIGLVDSVKEYVARFSGRDGCRPADLRLWGADNWPDARIGDTASLY